MTTILPVVEFTPLEAHPGTPLRIVVDRLPLSLNFWTRKFWHVRTKDAENMRQHVVAGFGVKRVQWCRINGPWFRVPVSVHCLYHIGNKTRDAAGRFYTRKIDTDNLVPKHIIDALKGLAFADDTARHIPRVTNEVVFVEGAGSRTIVTIAPYEP